MRTLNYEGMLIKSARIYSNDPGGIAVLSLRAFVAAPIFVSPRYVSFYGFEQGTPSVEMNIEAGRERALILEPGDFSLDGKVTYTIREVEKGRTFRITFEAVPGSLGSFRGYLNLKTNYQEKSLLNIRIIGRFAEDQRDETG